MVDQEAKTRAEKKIDEAQTNKDISLSLWHKGLSSTPEAFSQLQNPNTMYLHRYNLDLSLEEFRPKNKKYINFVNEIHAADTKYIDTVIEEPEYCLPIKVRIYEAQGGGPFPTIFWIPGTGFIGDHQDHMTCSQLAKEARYQLIVINPPTTPQHTPSVIYGSTYSAFKYLLKRAAKFAIDPNCIMLGGCSSGGCIATTVAYRARKENNIKLESLLLISPVTDLSQALEQKYPEFEKYRKEAQADKAVHPKLLEWFLRILQSSDPNLDLRDPRFSPFWMDHNELKQYLCRVFIAYGEFDCTKVDDRAYEKMLEKAGLLVQANEIKDGNHGSFWHDPILVNWIRNVIQETLRVKSIPPSLTFSPR